MKNYLILSTMIGLLLGGLLAYLDFSPKSDLPLPLGAGQMQFVTIIKDNIDKPLIDSVKVGQSIKIGAVLYDKNNNRIDSGRLVYVEVPKQASYSRNKHTNAFTQADNGLYTIDYVATSTGIHEIEFWTIDPDLSSVSRDIIVSKKIQLLVK